MSDENKVVRWNTKHSKRVFLWGSGTNFYDFADGRIDHVSDETSGIVV